MKTAILVLGHGSKAPQALETLKRYGEMVKAASGCEIVEVASLQFDKPDLPEGISNAVKKGAEKVVIVPLFLYNGIHLQEDIPQVLAEEKVKYPSVEIVMTENLGADNRIVEIVMDRVKEVS